MAQTVQRVNVEQLRELLEGASAQQVQAVASALEKAVGGEEKKGILQEQKLTMQYACDDKGNLTLEVQTWLPDGRMHTFQGRGKGSRPGAAGALEARVDLIPESVYKEAAGFLLWAWERNIADKEHLIFWDKLGKELYRSPLLPVKCGEAGGLGRWE